jgi:myo-inositol-1-phosphate synthase
MSKRRARIGLWLIGAGGGIGGTVALGLAALRKGLTSQTGLVSSLPEFASLNLVGFDQIVLGGHEVRSTTLLESARATHLDSQVIHPETLRACTASVRSMQRRIKPGVVYGARSTVASDDGNVRRVASTSAAVEVVRTDLEAFRSTNRLDHVVVVNIACTEPPVRRREEHADYASLVKAMRGKGSDVLPTSSIYALGALSADCSYINFTPSVGMDVPAIEEFARDRDVLFMGRDGKTGETLLKSVLAPMFAMRNLKLLSWVGHNVLGNRDGANLADPAVKVSKIKSKDRLVRQIVGYEPLTRTSIEFIPSLNDWKVAWDFIHFEGFLQTKMNLQFVWTGSDSILAAPLVIDLARLTAHEWSQGRRGLMPHLACFFKDPCGASDHSLFEQWSVLMQHLHGHENGAPA